MQAKVRARITLSKAQSFRTDRTPLSAPLLSPINNWELSLKKTKLRLRRPSKAHASLEKRRKDKEMRKRSAKDLPRSRRKRQLPSKPKPRRKRRQPGGRLRLRRRREKKMLRQRLRQSGMPMRQPKSRDRRKQMLREGPMKPPL